MTTNPFIWSALLLYVGVTLFFTIQGMRKTGDLKSFAVGSGAISPSLVGLSLTAQLTSVATFVVNPGLVYYYGLSALMGLGVAAGSGIFVGLILLSGPFRTVGAKVKALTIPQWIGARYDSKLLRIFFAIISLCLISFIVLIAVAIAKTLGALLVVESATTLYIIVAVVMIFVFSYTLLGGANTSTYTNAIQAMIMLVVALILISSGFPLIFSEEGILSKLASISPSLIEMTSPSSLYFRNFFEVFICNFVVGLAIVCQPHILGKSLLLNSDKQVKKYLFVALLSGTVFVGVMIVGLYARVTLPAMVSIDSAVAAYIGQTFSVPTKILISIGLLCAGISTLEGLLLALSTIFSSDIYMTIKGVSTEEGREVNLKNALMFGRLALVVIGIGCIFLSIWQLKNPTGGSVAIFAQYGVYLLFTATFLPIVSGLFLPSIGRRTVTMGVFVSVGFYFLPIILQKMLPSFPFIYMANNPAVLAFTGIIAGWISVLSSKFLLKG